MFYTVTVTWVFENRVVRKGLEGGSERRLEEDIA